jgi:hypothetical protein
LERSAITLLATGTQDEEEKTILCFAWSLRRRRNQPADNNKETASAKPEHLSATEKSTLPRKKKAT